LSLIQFLTNYAVEVSAASSGSLTANVAEDVIVSGNTLSGDATVPSGALVKLQNGTTDQTIDLPRRSLLDAHGIGAWRRAFAVG
jgi:hypothetical protein